MSNLENLTQKIIEDAKNKAELIIAESTKNNEEIVSSKVRDAKEKSKKLIERAISEASMMKERVVSNAELKVRDEKLKAKQQIMDRVFNNSREKLSNISEEDFVKFLTSNIKGMQFKGTEQLIVPKNMIAKVKSLGLATKVSEEKSVELGFLIKDNDITLNYSFSSLIDYLRDGLESEIAQELFKG